MPPVSLPAKNHLAPHFDTHERQFDSAKLGMWLFLATEVLLFGGLFCLYAAFRRTHPEIFAYGSQFLDTRLGILNTSVLITSSVTMALAVRAAQLGRFRSLVSLLVVTFLFGAVFMTVKYVEYHHKLESGLVWGPRFYRAPAWAKRERDRRDARAAALLAGKSGEPAAAAPGKPHVADPANGLAIWEATCRSCHGSKGQGVTGQGKDIRGVDFVTSRSDAEMVGFLKVGRERSDPLNTTGVAMPPRGGNPLLTDDDLLDVVAHVRTLRPEGAPEGGAAPAPVEEEFWVHRSSLPPAPEGPAGLRSGYRARPGAATAVAPPAPLHHAVDRARPDKAHLFFAIYFLMTGLHGLHVLGGMVLLAWLAWRAMRRHFGPAYYTPVDLGGLYWHIVDLIWIFLFPLLYLIS